MIRLTKHSLTPTGSFDVETESLTLAEKDSSVTFTVALPAAGESAAPLPDAPSLEIGDWLMEEDDPGKGLVWRIKSIEDDYGKRIRTVTAEHIIQILKDTCMFGEVNPDDMGGSSTVCTAQQAISYALSWQSDWTLGGFGYQESAGYSFNSDSILEAINTVCGTLEDPWWTLDVSAYPFKLYIAPKATTPDCEMRMSRNITTIRKSIDASQLYTRIYPIGKDDLHITGSYLSRNENVYGVIHKVETNQSIDSEAGLIKWAQLRLKKHSEPAVTVSISGLELSGATGEPLDHLRPGKMCQVPLPEYGTVILETLTKMVWRDKKKEPKNVTVTLANEIVDLATIIKEENESNTGGSGSGGRTSASAGKKKNEEDHAWMVDTTDHVALVAEAVAGEGAATDWSRVAEVVVDGDGVHQRVTRTEGELVTAQAAIDVLEDEIDLKVSVGDVSTQLSVECGNVHITGTPGAANLVVDGYVTTAGLSSAIGDIATLMVQDINGASAVFEGDVGADGLYVSTIELNGYQVNIVDAELSVDGKSLIISKADGTSVTFSKATTLDPTWSGSTLSVKAQQTNGGSTSTVATHLVELGGNYTSGRTTLEFVNDGQAPSVVTVLGAKTLSVPLKVRSLNSGNTTPTTRLTTSISCDPSNVLESKTGTSKITANGTYYPGTNYIGFSAVEVDVQGGTVNTGLEIDTTNHEIRTSTTSTTQSVAIASTVSLLYNSSNHKYTATGEALANGTTIHAATAVVSGTQAYNDGWGDAYADVSLPTTNTSDNFTVTTPSSTVGGTAVSTTYTISNSTDNMVQVKSGSGTVVGRFTHNKYNTGFNAVGSPTITWPSTITTGTRENSINIKAAVDDKTTGATRSTTMTLSIGQSTFTTSGGITGYPCVNLYSAANQGGNIIGRSDCGAIHNNGGKTAWLYRQSGSSWVKVTKNTTLGFGQTLRVRYTAANKNVANVTDALFYSPTLNLQSKDITTATTTTIYPDSGYDGLSSVIVRPAHQSYFTLTRGTKIQDNVYQYTVTLGSNVTGNAQTFTVYY